MPVAPWPGVRDATVPGNPAPQSAQSFADVTSVDEDCLTLDVTVPEAPGAGRPVMVWLHGGGGTNGTVSAPPSPPSTVGSRRAVIPSRRSRSCGGSRWRTCSRRRPPSSGRPSAAPPCPSRPRRRCPPDASTGCR
ncbi:carboxylesterase family protein [Streptosporangium sp. NPDC003464]